MELSKSTRIGKAYLYSIGLWSALSLLTGWQYLIFDHSLNIHSTLVEMLCLAEGRGLAFALLTPPIFYLVRRYNTGTRHLVRRLFLYCLGVGPYMVVYACIRWLIVPPWSAALQRFVSRSSSGPLALVHDGFAEIITIYIATVVAAHAYAYFARVRAQELERSEYQQALAASELQALKMQLHPHFLFNTLHGISTLIDSDGKSAKEMIVKLSSLLRIALAHSGSDLIPLHEELKFIREYLDLEKMRFGERLTIDWSIDAVTKHLLVPQLILQPLVENAIRHGIASSREKSWVEITAQQEAGVLELKIRNSVGPSIPRGTGLGLRNTEARLKYLYSNEATFHFEINEDRTAITRLVVPGLRSQQLSTEKSRMPESSESEAEHHARTYHR
jgi:two-component system, LytTR family, sensor kinase